MKYPIPDASYTIWNNNATQRTATHKCIITNAGYTVWNNNLSQRRVSPKRHITNNLCSFSNGISTIKLFWSL